MLMRLEGVGRQIGDRVLFAGVDLELRAGDRFGLIGPNGAGKTTLLRIAAGLDPPDSGRRMVSRGVQVALLQQEIDPSVERSVREETASALADLDALEQELRSLEGQMAELGRSGHDLPDSLAERYDRLHARFTHEGGFDRATRVERVLAGLGFDEADRDRPLRSFSGGWLMRVELAKLLLADPDVMLLDEPTNHLDLPSIQWFEETLESYRGAIVVVSHDRTFLRRNARRIAALEPSGFHVSSGGLDRYLAEREQRRTLLSARVRTQDREIAEAERFITRFRAKASKARQVQSRVKALGKIERIQLEGNSGRRMRMRIPAPSRAGATVLRLHGVHKAYGEVQVYGGLDFELHRGEKVALVGPNGAGKSTLLRIAAGVLAFERGERVLGHNVRCAFFAQHQLETLSPEATVLEELGGVAHTEDHPRLRSHLGSFLFSGDAVDKKVGVLSGGEKARLALAKLLLRPANFLVLDEPTNHLDLEACEVLEGALAGYTGTLLVISHDRSFIDALATRVIEVRGGEIREFLGNYSDYRRALEEGGGSVEQGGSVPGHGQRRATNEARGVAKETRKREREQRKRTERLRRDIDRQERSILEREQTLEALRWRAGDPETYRDAERMRTLAEERSALEDEVRQLYRRWEELATELEDLEDSAPAEPEA